MLAVTYKHYSFSDIRPGLKWFIYIVPNHDYSNVGNTICRSIILYIVTNISGISKCVCHYPNPLIVLPELTMMKVLDYILTL